MPSALTSMRGAFLNCRFAVNGIQKASRLLVETLSATSRDYSARAVAISPMARPPTASVRPDRTGRLRRRAFSSRRRRRDFLTIWSRESLDSFQMPAQGAVGRRGPPDRRGASDARSDDRVRPPSATASTRDEPRQRRPGASHAQAHPHPGGERGEASSTRRSRCSRPMAFAAPPSTRSRRWRG